MLKVPAALTQKYDRLLVNSDIAPREYPACRKWLRFYLDFCKKYGHGYADTDSLALFLNKLKSKNQNDRQQNQAGKAVRLYYKGLEEHPPAEPPKPDHKKPEQNPTVPKLREDLLTFIPGESNTPLRAHPWDASIETLEDEINVRHYSGLRCGSGSRNHLFIYQKDPTNRCFFGLALRFQYQNQQCKEFGLHGVQNYCRFHVFPGESP